MAAFPLADVNIENLVNQDGTSVDPQSIVGKVIGLYFSAHWCGPCREFTPRLAAKYTELVGQGSALEIIFVSADEDEEAAAKYFAEMPWKMLAFHDRDTQDILNKKYQVEGIPTLVLLDAMGEVITARGRECVTTAPFDSWKTWEADRVAEEERAARELEELRKNFNIYSFLASSTIRDAGGEAVAAERLAGKTIGLYFSAHWCPPCRRFTPELAEKYKSIVADGHPFEIVFLSSDRDAASATEYFADMPWLMLDYGDRKRRQQLSEVFDVSGIPTLVLLDSEGLITDDGCELIMSAPFPDLRGFVERQQAEEARWEQAIGTLPDEVVIAEHPHPLAKLPSVYHGAYGCDVCHAGGSGWVYHCAECGWDAHPRCACKTIV